MTYITIIVSEGYNCPAVTALEGAVTCRTREGRNARVRWAVQMASILASNVTKQRLECVCPYVYVRASVYAYV